MSISIHVKRAIFAIRIASVATSFGAPTTQTIVLRTNYTNFQYRVSANLGEELSHVSVFPNPCSNMVNECWCQRGYAHFLYDITGSRAEHLSSTMAAISLMWASISGLLHLHHYRNNGKRVKPANWLRLNFFITESHSVLGGFFFYFE